MRRKFTPVNGHTLYVEERGPAGGAAVILLHHGLGSVRAWREQVPALAAAGYRVIAYDRWGYGKSDPRPEFSMPFFNEDLQDLEVLLDEMQIDRVSLVGHSDGGTIALYFAARRPQRVCRLVTLGAHVYVEAKMTPGILGVYYTFMHDADFRRKFRRVHGDKFEQVFQSWFAGWTRPEVQTWDLRPRLGSIRCPALVVQGLEDEHATPQHAREIASAIPCAELWLAPGAGHMLQKDAAELFNQKLLEFLKESRHVQ